MLQLRPNCECCHRYLPPETPEARAQPEACLRFISTYCSSVICSRSCG